LFRQTGVFPTATRKIDVTSSLIFDFNLVGSTQYLQRVILPSFDSVLKGKGMGKLGTQIGLVQTQLKRIQMGAKGISPYFVLAAVGIDAIQEFCKGAQDDCRFKESSENVADSISKLHANRQALPPETKALFLDSTKYVPYAIASGLVEGMDKNEFLKFFQ
jgi:hypothetical protein